MTEGSAAAPTRTPEILRLNEQTLLAEWLQHQLSAKAFRSGRLKETELREQSLEFLSAFTRALQNGKTFDSENSAWSEVCDVLGHLSRSRATQGFTSAETAMFVFSLKQPVFTRLRQELGRDTAALAEETWAISNLIDQLGLYTVDLYQKGREQVISRQQQDLMELSTPVVKLWEGVLALPLIGTLDSSRTQVVMESLLEQIVSTGASLAIIDITGVPTVDTLVAQHLLKTVAAARLMGADCIISGIRPQIAQTIVHLGVELGNVITKASLADAFAIALERSGLTITRLAQRA
jgi:rsbT co-antagonist protein RsbR